MNIRNSSYVYVNYKRICHENWFKRVFLQFTEILVLGKTFLCNFELFPYNLDTWNHFELQVCKCKAHKVMHDHMDSEQKIHFLVQNIWCKGLCHLWYLVVFGLMPLSCTELPPEEMIIGLHTQSSTYRHFKKCLLKVAS